MPAVTSLLYYLPRCRVRLSSGNDELCKMSWMWGKFHFAAIEKYLIHFQIPVMPGAGVTRPHHQPLSIKLPLISWFFA